jgi:hypothetical protein
MISEETNIVSFKNEESNNCPDLLIRVGNQEGRLLQDSEIPPKVFVW